MFLLLACWAGKCRLGIAECPTPYIRVSFTEYPAPYKCVLLRIDTIRTRALYKNATPVGSGMQYNVFKACGYKNSPFC